MDTPYEYCPEQHCGKKLVEKPPVKGTLLTITYGKLPILCPSTYCKGERNAKRMESKLKERSITDCKIRFYHNYSVKKASEKDSTRDFYDDRSPRYLEVQEHVYADLDFCNWVRMEIAMNR